MFVSRTFSGWFPKRPRISYFVRLLTFFEGDDPAVHQPELGSLEEASLVLPSRRLQLTTLSLPLHLLVSL